MFKRLKQLFCTHWFLAGVSYSDDEDYGAIVCAQQKTHTVTRDTRVCDKCGLKESRVVSVVEQGWQ